MLVLTAEPHCHQTASESVPERFVTVATLYTILTARQTVIAFLPPDLTAGKPPYAATYLNRTFTGPTTASRTTVHDLFPLVTPDRFGGAMDGGAPPGMMCGGACGLCEIIFPTAYVYYWPIVSPNTACLASTASNCSTPVTKREVYDLPAGKIVAEPRSLAGLPDSVSTIVNSNGFTLWGSLRNQLLN